MSAGTTSSYHYVNSVPSLQKELKECISEVKEMDAVFKVQDRQMEARARKILSDRIELKHSDNIKSSDELRAEKAGAVGFNDSGEYYPATRRRIRLSF
jgi:hypothetical protein